MKPWQHVLVCVCILMWMIYIHVVLRYVHTYICMCLQWKVLFLDTRFQTQAILWTSYTAEDWDQLYWDSRYAEGSCGTSCRGIWISYQVLQLYCEVFGEHVPLPSLLGSYFHISKDIVQVTRTGYAYLPHESDDVRVFHWGALYLYAMHRLGIVSSTGSPTSVPVAILCYHCIASCQYWKVWWPVLREAGCLS